MEFEHEGPTVPMWNQEIKNYERIDRVKGFFGIRQLSSYQSGSQSLFSSAVSPPIERWKGSGVYFVCSADKEKNQGRGLTIFLENERDCG